MGGGGGRKIGVDPQGGLRLCVRLLRNPVLGQRLIDGKVQAKLDPSDNGLTRLPG